MPTNAAKSIPHSKTISAIENLAPARNCRPSPSSRVEPLHGIGDDLLVVLAVILELVGIDHGRTRIGIDPHLAHRRPQAKLRPPDPHFDQRLLKAHPSPKQCGPWVVKPRYSGRSRATRKYAYHRRARAPAIGRANSFFRNSGSLCSRFIILTRNLLDLDAFSPRDRCAPCAELGAGLFSPVELQDASRSQIRTRCAKHWPDFRLTRKSAPSASALLCWTRPFWFNRSPWFRPAKTAKKLDARDPLAHLRERFVLPDGVIYLDGKFARCDAQSGSSNARAASSSTNGRHGSDYASWKRSRLVQPPRRARRRQDRAA